MIGRSEQTGTKITFHPDPEIFEVCEFNLETLSYRLRELAFLNRGLTIEIEDERIGKKSTFHYEGGISSFVEHLNKSKTPLFEDVIYIHQELEDNDVEVAIQYNDGFMENVYTFANNINTKEGGTHLSGFRSALTRSFNDYARKNNLLKENESNLSGEDVWEGLTAVLSVKLRFPQFEGQTKMKLGNSEIKGIVESVVYEDSPSF